MKNINKSLPVGYLVKHHLVCSVKYKLNKTKSNNIHTLLDSFCSELLWLWKFQDLMWQYLWKTKPKSIHHHIWIIIFCSDARKPSESQFRWSESVESWFIWNWFFLCVFMGFSLCCLIILEDNLTELSIALSVVKLSSAYVIMVYICFHVMNVQYE